LTHGRRLHFLVINVSIKTDTSLPLNLFFTGIRIFFYYLLRKITNLASLFSSQAECLCSFTTEGPQDIYSRISFIVLLNLIRLSFSLPLPPCPLSIDVFTARYVHSPSYWFFIQCFIWDVFFDFTHTLHWSSHGHLHYEQDFHYILQGRSQKLQTEVINDCSKTSLTR
jgi:hypothetical protein